MRLFEAIMDANHRDCCRAGVPARFVVLSGRLMSTLERIREILVSLSDEERETVARYVEALSGQSQLPVESGKHCQKNFPEDRKFSDER